MNTRMEGRLSRLEQHRGGSFAAWVGIPLAQWPDQMLGAFVCSEGGEEWRSLTDANLLAILEAPDGACDHDHHCSPPTPNRP